MAGVLATSGDVLDGDWDPDAWWSTTNFGEAIPGVLTPLNWSWWSEPGERAARRAFAALGAMSDREAELPADPRQRAFGIFHGRFACKVDFLAGLGDRLPGTTGAAVAEQVLGELPPDFVLHPTKARYPAVARRMPRLVVSLPRRLAAQHEETGRWWAAEVHRIGGLDLAAARAAWQGASDRFVDVGTLHVACLFAGVQAAFDQVVRLAADAGDAELAGRVMVGMGSHAELVFVEDLWRLSRDQLTLEEFIVRHGYHGPLEGEISARTWREDSRPVVQLAERYRAMDDADSPLAVAARNAQLRAAARAQLLGRLGPLGRMRARAILAMAVRYLPLRGVGKVSFLQTLDVARAATRRIGTHLEGAGTLEDRDDAFLLLAPELLETTPGTPLGELVAIRRAQRAAHETVRLPGAWRGRPQTEPIVAGEAADRSATLTGIGASPGVVEGPVRIVLDPTFDDVEDGEILVAPTTDPSWASIMLTSAALVVDLGGQLSHAAVVARELGVPCVMGTRDGTRRLQTGDICRVDGHAGTVEVLRPADD